MENCTQHTTKDKSCLECLDHQKDTNTIPVTGIIIIHPKIEDAYIFILKNKDICITTSKYYSAELIVPTAETIAREMNLEITWSDPPKEKSLIFIPQKRF